MPLRAGCDRTGEAIQTEACPDETHSTVKVQSQRRPLPAGRSLIEQWPGAGRGMDCEHQEHRAPSHRAQLLRDGVRINEVGQLAGASSLGAAKPARLVDSCS